MGKMGLYGMELTVELYFRQTFLSPQLAVIHVKEQWPYLRHQYFGNAGLRDSKLSSFPLQKQNHVFHQLSSYNFTMNSSIQLFQHAQYSFPLIVFILKKQDEKN